MLNFCLELPSCRCRLADLRQDACECYVPICFLKHAIQLWLNHLTVICLWQFCLMCCHNQWQCFDWAQIIDTVIASPSLLSWVNLLSIFKHNSSCDSKNECYCQCCCQASRMNTAVNFCCLDMFIVLTTVTSNHAVIPVQHLLTVLGLDSMFHPKLLSNFQQSPPICESIIYEQIWKLMTT